MSANRYPRPRGGSQNHRMPHQMNYHMMSSMSQARPLIPHGQVHQQQYPVQAATQLYMPQQPTGLSYAGAASFNTAAFHQYQPAPQQMRQFQPPTTHHPYPQQQQPAPIMPMNPATAGGMTIMDTQMLQQGTTPPNLSYMAHHPPIQQQPPSTVSQQAPVAKASKAIKIVNPNTMKELDMKNLKSSSPVSSAMSTPKPEADQQLQQQFKHNVYATASDDVTMTQPMPPIATVTPLVSGRDVTTTVSADNTANLPNTTSMDEKPKPTVTPPISDTPQPLTSECVHQKEFKSDDISSEVVADKESEMVSEQSINVSDAFKSSDAQVKKTELPLEASIESFSPEQRNVEINNSSSVSHDDSKAEEIGEVHKPDTDMVIKEADDTLQKNVVYKCDGEEVSVLQQQMAAEKMKVAAEEELAVQPTLDEPPSLEDKQHVDEEAPAKLTEPLPMETGGDVPEEDSKNLVSAEEDSKDLLSTEEESKGLPSTEEKKDDDVGEQLVTMEQEPDDDEEKGDNGEDDRKDMEAAAVDQPASLSKVAEEDNGDDIATEKIMVNGEEQEEGEIIDDDDDEDDDEDDENNNKHYTRDFLLSLQFLDQCKQRPAKLQNAEYIRKEQMKQSEMRFDPPGPPGHYGGEYNRRRGSHIVKRKIDLPTKEPVELRKADKRWVRPQDADGILGESEKETQELFRKFVSILNKLTPQKFETLANQALQLPVNTEERLKGCIDRIFSKALEEPNFSVAYAQLCRVLSKVSVEVGTGPEAKKKTFRSLLLTKCQQEFEKDKESDDALNELRKKVEEAATPEEKKQLEEELDETEYRVRHKYLGNIKFIGELFKIKMLSEGIMHECIRRLLQHTGDEEALECFAKLMFTIGKDLDHEKGHGLIQQYMDRVDLIIKAGKISSRIKFFLQDVVELRNCHWVPRRENNNPKKIDQIHEEAKQEEAEKQRQLAVHAAGPPMGGRQMSKGPIDYSRKGGKDAGGKIGGDWQAGGDKDKKSATTQQPPKLDSNKFRNIGKGGPFSLAPSNKLMSMRPGGGGGGGAEKMSRQDSTKKPSRSSGSKRDSRGSINAGSAATSGQTGGPRRSHSGPDKHRERQSALELASSMSRPGSSSSSKGAEGKTVSVLKRPAPDALSEEEVEKKASLLIAEFCQNVDYQAAIEEVKDLKSPGKHPRLVCQIINDVLEKTNKARTDTGKLFHKLVKEEVVEKEKFVAGFTEVLEFAEDIEIDVPKIWQYLGEIVVPVIEDGTISLDILTKAPSSVIESGKAALLLAEVLKLSEKIMGGGHVSTMWTKSSVSYSNFRISDVEEFKRKHGLQFLPDVATSMVADVKQLTEILKSRDKTNTEIMQYIEKQHPESKECSLVFIRDFLGTSMFHAVIDGSGSSARYNEELLESRMEVVAKYIQPQNDSQHQRQVEFLCAMQIVLHDLEHPAGVAASVCKKLSETGIFEDAAFFRWRDSAAAGIVGHGATMMALKKFYEWLDTTPVESDYSQ